MTYETLIAIIAEFLRLNNFSEDTWNMIDHGNKNLIINNYMRQAEHLVKVLKDVDMLKELKEAAE